MAGGGVVVVTAVVAISAVSPPRTVRSSAGAEVSRSARPVNDARVVATTTPRTSSRIRRTRDSAAVRGGSDVTAACPSVRV